MFFESEATQDEECGAACEALETDDYEALWKGFLFVRGCVAGKESVRALLESFRKDGPEETLARPKGSYLLCIRDKGSRERFCSVDAFGLVRLFAADGLVSDDLFALIARLGYDDAQLDREALAFFVRFGFYGFGRTIDRRVRFLAGEEIACVSSAGGMRILRKAFPDFRLPAKFDFAAYIADVRTAIAGQRVSLDLTGGYDSRLLAACLKEQVDETATTGQPGNHDAAIARRVAAALRLPHAMARHDVSGLANRAASLLRLMQGQMGVLTYDHIHQFTLERQARGATLALSGIGGELWKDILWLQDFPFLAGSPRFERLYSMRLEPRPPSEETLTAAFAKAFAQARQSYLAAMSAQCGALPRTAAYDCVYAFQRIPFTAGPSVSAGVRMGLPTFCPLYDRDGVIASMHKRPRERLFARWHRETIARAAPAIAQLRTDDGLSARRGVAALADLPFYAGNKAIRLAQKIAQRFGLPDIRHLSLDDPRTLATARSLPLAQTALNRLREASVMREGASAANVSRAMFDRLLTLGMTLGEISPR